MNTNLRTGNLLGRSFRRRARRLHEPGGQHDRHRRRRHDRDRREHQHRRTGAGGGSGNGVACGVRHSLRTRTAGVALPAAPRVWPHHRLHVRRRRGATRRRRRSRFGDDATTLSGGESTYANTARADHLGRDRRGDWHISGNVGQLLRLRPLLRQRPRRRLPATWSTPRASRGSRSPSGGRWPGTRSPWRCRDRRRHPRASWFSIASTRTP